MSSMMRTRTPLVVLAALLFSGSIDVVNADPLQQVVWPGEPSYAARVETLPVSPAKALALLVDQARTHEHLYFHKSVMLLAGDDYFFPSKISKTELLLEGFYVSGRTGRIEFRRSSATIARGASSLPTGAFSQIEPMGSVPAPGPEEFVAMFVASFREDTDYFREFVSEHDAQIMVEAVRPYMTPRYEVFHHEKYDPDDYEYSLRFTNGGTAIVSFRDHEGKITNAYIIMNERPDHPNRPSSQ
jgi:hypothetical protein